jgi:hypothetical protein
VCGLTKEFLGAHNVEFESVVISEQRERWLADGSPPVPTLVIDGTAHILQHPSQAGLLLGLETPPALRDAVQVAWEIDAVADAWRELATTTPWEALLTPMPVLNRTPLALAVDACVGLEALLEPFETGWFHWPGNPVTGETGDQAVVAYEASIVATIRSRDDLLAFVGAVSEAWGRFALDKEAAFRADPARAVRTPRGQLTWVELLEAQRLHAAQHYRQAATQVASLGHPVPALALENFYGMRLPEEIY